MEPISVSRGDIVLLTDQRIGVVVDVNGGKPARPIIRLFDSDAPGSQLSPELDLAKHEGVAIDRVIPPSHLETRAKGRTDGKGSTPWRP